MAWMSGEAWEVKSGDGGENRGEASDGEGKWIGHEAKVTELDDAEMESDDGGRMDGEVQEMNVDD